MSDNKQQSSVQWFYDKLIEHGIIVVNQTTYQVKCKHEILLEQAKEMEKERMDKVAGDWWNEGACYVSGGERKYESFEHYYNKTYGGNK